MVASLLTAVKSENMYTYMRCGLGCLQLAEEESVFIRFGLSPKMVLLSL